jgi:long-chain fatty acid transport protein
MNRSSSSLALLLALSAGALAIAAPAPARAAGTALDVQSGRGTGMASAVTGFIDDSSAIYYNAAGIAQGKILDAQIGDTLIIPAFRYTTPGGASTTNAAEVIPPFQAYVSGGITDDLSIGIGVFTPYGSTIKWPDGWVGKSQITTSDLATYDINPTVAYRLGPVRLGAGLQIVRATVDLKKKIETGSQEVSTELGGGAWGVGANVGAQVEAIKQYLLFGVHYRSQVRLDFSGNAHFDDVPVELQGTLHDQAVTTSLTNPDSIAFAVASRPTTRLVLDAEAVWFNWSVFKSIDIQFPNDASGTLSSTQPKNWSNTVNWRVGGEYGIDDAWRVRAGVLYDPSPSPANTLTPDIPDADRLNLAVGGSYHHPSGFYADLGYQFLLLFRRTSTAPALPGDYDGIANIIGISVGYRTPRTRAYEPAPATDVP